MNRASVIGNNKVKYCFHIAVSIRELGRTSAWWRIVASKSTSPSSSRCLMIATVGHPSAFLPFVTTIVTGVPKRGPSSTWVVAQEWLYVNEQIASVRWSGIILTEQIRRGEWIANGPFTSGNLYEPLSYYQRLQSFVGIGDSFRISYIIGSNFRIHLSLSLVCCSESRNAAAFS